MSKGPRPHRGVRALQLDRHAVWARWELWLPPFPRIACGSAAGITAQTAIKSYVRPLCPAGGWLTAGLYSGLPSTTAPKTCKPPGSAVGGLGPSKKRVYVLATLFSLDAFGGGFVVQSLIALWLYQRFGLSMEAAGVHLLLDRPADSVLLSGGGTRGGPAASGWSRPWSTPICRRACA